MASNVRFTEKAVALYGAVQTGGAGIPNALSSAHALAALSLSYENNITSQEEQYIGNIMQREVAITITDKYCDVKAETIVPRLGSLFGRPIYGYETAVLKFLDSVSSGTFIFAGATMTVTSLASPNQLAEELVAYLGGGSPTQLHSTFTGTPNVAFSYVINAQDPSIILATALAANTNVASLTLAGTQVAFATLDVNDQTTGAINTIPIIPFMEASKFHAILDSGLSITDALYDLYRKAEAQLQVGYTETNWIENALVNAQRNAQKMDLLDLGVSGNAAVSALLANLTSARAETADIIAKVTATSVAIKELWHNLQINLIGDPTGAALVVALKADDLIVDADVALIDVATLATLIDTVTYINAITNSNPAVEQEFQTLFDKTRDFYLQAEDREANLAPLLTTGTYAAKTYLDAASAVVQPVGFTTASLIPVVASIEFTNEYASNETLTLHVRKSSDQLVGTQKAIIVTDAVATLDLTLEVGQRPKVAFNYHGNVWDVANIPELSYPISQQKADAAYVLKADTIRNASLMETGSGLILNNLCFFKLTGSNLDGFEHQRIMTGCEDTWDVSAKAGEVTITIIEPEANTNIVDQFNAEDSLGKEFWFNFKQDGTRGNTVEVEITKLTLKDYKQTAQNNRAAFDLVFAYGGYTKIMLK